MTGAEEHAWAYVGERLEEPSDAFGPAAVLLTVAPDDSTGPTMGEDPVAGDSSDPERGPRHGASVAHAEVLTPPRRSSRGTWS